MFLHLAALLVVAVAAVVGWRRGGVALALRVLGRVGGLLAGLRAATLLAASLSPAAHVLLGALCALGGVLLGGALGKAVGRRASAVVARLHLRLPDRIVGAAGGGLGVLLVGWLVLRLLASAGPADVAALVPALGASAPGTATVDRVAASASAAVVEIAATGCRGSVVGTGFAVGDGLVVTNAHVVRAASDVSVDGPAGEFDATPVVVDRRADLAVLRTAGTRLPSLRLAAADAANATPAIVIGHPHGGPLRAVPAVIEQRLPVPDPGLSDGLALHVAYRLRADVEPGNSGSPLLDGLGRVLGVVNASGLAGQGYAIADSELRPVLQRARASGASVAGTGDCT